MSPSWCVWVSIAFKTFWIKMVKIVQISALIFSILTDFSPASTKGTIFEKRKTDGKQTNWHFVIVQLKMCIGNIYPHYIVSYFFHITYTFIFPQMQCTHQLKKFLHTLPFKMFGLGQKVLSRLPWSKFWPILANQ